jgi:hypothetical protein
MDGPVDFEALNATVFTLLSLGLQWGLEPRVVTQKSLVEHSPVSHWKMAWLELGKLLCLHIVRNCLVLELSCLQETLLIF